MADQPMSESEVIEAFPTGDLPAFFEELRDKAGRQRPSFRDVSQLNSDGKYLDLVVVYHSNRRLDHRAIALALIEELAALDTGRHLASDITNNATLSEDLDHVVAIVNDSYLRISYLEPLIRAAVLKKPDKEIWAEARGAVAELSLLPWQASQESLELAEHTGSTHPQARFQMELALTENHCPLFVGLDAFHETHFGDIANLKAASEAVFEECRAGNHPIFANGWVDFPEGANAGPNNLDPSDKMDVKKAPAGAAARILVANPVLPLNKNRNLDFGFAADKDAWGASQILVPGRIRCNDARDEREIWLSVARYAGEVLCSQATRRFVIAFNISGSLMRVWKFDRLGGVASDQFDIHQDGLRFVQTILGLLWMNEEQLGFDPTIKSTPLGQQYVEIDRDGAVQKIIIDQLIKQPSGIDCRGTTCWKAHSEAYPDLPLVIKDSWQVGGYDEPFLLQEATNKGVKNVARFYHHSTVLISGAVDDVRQNVRKGLDVAAARDFLSVIQSQTSNRVHHRLILSNYGRPIESASSRIALLDALDVCIEGHKSLLTDGGILHQDISLNNLVINEGAADPSERAFLIDLNMAIRLDPQGDSKTVGTKPFMAVAIMNDVAFPHYFGHDLESFFWVLFWICVQFNGPGDSVGNHKFSHWFDEELNPVMKDKMKTISRDDYFEFLAEENFTPYFHPLIPWMCKLRTVVFPHSEYWRSWADMGLYDRMQTVLRDAQNDPAVQGILA
ncbi:hypothetical protein Hte_008323 [Hypoxylon texense]